MCDYDGGYYDGGGYTEDIVHHDIVHHDVVHHDVVHDYYAPHVDYCAPHVDLITPGIGIGVGVGVGSYGYGYPGPRVDVIAPVAPYGAPVVGYPAPPPVGYVQDVHVVHPTGPVVYTREPDVTCCGTCTIL